MRRSLLVFGEYDDWKTPAISWLFGAETPAAWFPVRRLLTQSCQAVENRHMNGNLTAKRSRHSHEWTKSPHVSILPVSGLSFLLKRAGVPSIKALKRFYPVVHFLALSGEGSAQALNSLAGADLP